MKNIRTILFLLIGTVSFGQNPECSDFKNGTFTLELVIPVKMKGKLIRNGSEECKIFTEMIEGGKDYFQLLDKEVWEKIEWIDDCSYRLTYDASKGELSEAQKLLIPTEEYQQNL